MKLGIGTANFNMKYGLRGEKISKREINGIKTFIKNKIKLIDTAEGYKNYASIKNIKNNNHKIITKLKVPKNCINLEIYVKKKLGNLFNKLNVKKIYGLLIHDVKDIAKYKDFLPVLKKIKNKKLVRKIGVSIYEPKDLKYLKTWLPDIIQFPYNIFDQRFSERILKKLKKNKIELHSRSCFLQGVLTENDNKKIIKFKNKMKKLDEWCQKNNIEKNEACINFVKNQKIIDYLIIGFTSLNELKENTSIFNKKEIKITSKFKINNQKLIDPRLW